MNKRYKVLKSDIFCKPYDKEGVKIRLEEKKAADYVKKGELEELPEKKPAAKTPPVKKTATKKEPPKKAKK